MFPVEKGEQGVVVELQRDAALLRRAGGRGGRPCATGLPGAEDDGGGVQAGAGSSAGRLAVTSSPAASRPEREFGWAARMRTGTSRPTRSRGAARCTGCSQGERP